MIITLIISVIFVILSFLINLLPIWHVWPAALLDGLNYFFIQLAKWNFIFPIDTLFLAIKSLITFNILFFGARLLLKVFGLLPAINTDKFFK